ncbi:MAG: DUF1761 domain-containing protein, partial [Saprospiraceae bacterium]
KKQTTMDSGKKMDTNYCGGPCAIFIGAMYYGPLFGKPWMKSIGFAEDDLKKANMPLSTA